MKRFGLKAIAAALALTMVASLGVPATAKAEDVKLIAPAPKAGNVLEITQSMVDTDGELVLSGEKLDKVVIPNDVDVKRIYVDGSEIGELSIESGNTPEIQIWDAQIKDVTVTPSELIDLNDALGEYIDVMIASEDPSKFDIAGFINDIQAKNKALSTEAPTVALKGADMEGSAQKVENITLSGNAKVDCADGTMPVALNVAYTSATQDMNVTISGYVGDMNITQSKSENGVFGIVNVKAEDSLFGTISVATEGEGNVILRSPDSVVETVKCTSVGDGTAEGLFSLNMPANNLVTDAGAKNCNISVLSSVDNIKMEGTEVAVDIGPNAEVMEASIAGADNSMTGAGNVAECTIEPGCVATVTMAGISNITGSNTFAPVVPMPQLPKPEPPSDVVLYNLNGSDTIEVTGNKAKMTGTYATASYDIPAEAQDKLKVIKITMESDKQTAIKLIDGSGNMLDLNGAGWCTDSVNWYNGSDEVTMKAVTKSYNVTGKTVTRIDFMSCGNDQLPLNVTVKDVELTLAEEGDDAGANLPDTVEYTFDELIYEWSNATYNVNDDGSVTVDFTGDYAGVKWRLPDSIDASVYTVIKLYDGEGEGTATMKVWKTGETADNPEVKSWDYKGVDGTLNLAYGETYEKFGVNGAAGATNTITFSKIVFAKSADKLPAEENAGGNGGGETGSGAPIYNFADLTPGGYGYTVDVVDGAIAGTINAQNQEIRFVLPEAVDLSQYDRIILDMTSDAALDIKLINPEAETNQWGAKTAFVDAYSAATITSPHTLEFDATEWTDYSAARNYSLSEIYFMCNVDGVANIVLNSITFE
ncbi:MAG: hypothetical protein IJZ55_10505 [Lachnospiraceae bacterium]|nr:hypothetical protein [Lachnospiraceae bacterium]